MANAKLMPIAYLIWMTWLYHNKSIPSDSCHYHSSKGYIRLNNMTGSAIHNPMPRRFLVASAYVEWFIIYNLDYGVSFRKASACKPFSPYL